MAGSVVTTIAAETGTQAGGRLAQRPFRAFLLVLGLQGACFWLGALVLFGLLDLPKDLSNIRAFSTAALFTASGLLGYLFVPFFLRLPCGKRTFRGYLDDIRLTQVRPFVPLLLLTLSCDAILILCQGSESIVYSLLHGRAVTLQSLAQVFDLSAALPPRSALLFAQMFSSLEEVAFRGVFLGMLLRKWSPRTAITISAAAFGILHLGSLSAGMPLVLVLGQITWAFLYGLFYGHLFVKSGSLLPSMVVHWLSNVFQEPLTAFLDAAPVLERAIYGVAVMGLAALLSILWVRSFSARWLAATNNRATELL